MLANSMEVTSKMLLPARSILTCLVAVLLTGSALLGQSDERPASEMYVEIERYETQARQLLSSRGTRYDASAREKILSDRRSLAKKYAAEIALRPGIKEKDYYYAARLYSIADNDQKALEMMKKFLSEIPSDAKGEMIQSALGNVIIWSSQIKQMDVAEAAIDRWVKGEASVTKQRAALQNHIAVGYFKDAKYEQAVKHARAAFDILKSTTVNTRQEKRDREKIYMNLVEVLALGYKKAKNSDQALEILAEARAESFALPSANLYRKVMDFVESSGFSEKKLMQRVDSYASADPAPDIKLTEWIGHEPIPLSQLRGKVVLLDFWATWCGPCISTFPRLRGWHKKYGGDDFMLIGVTQYYGTQEQKKMSPLQELDYLGDFKEKHKLPYALAVASSGEAEMKYGINAYPTTVLLDRDGIVRYIGIGAGDQESENLEDTIKRVLKENKGKDTRAVNP